MTSRVAVDSSALISILNREPEAIHFLNVLDEVQVVIGWTTVFETRIWSLRRNREQRSRWLDQWLSGATVTCFVFGQELESLASAAFERFGKGFHPACLNFGDCMSYAVAVHHDVPLLFKGADFGKTDVRVHKASILLD